MSDGLVLNAQGSFYLHGLNNIYLERIAEILYTNIYSILPIWSSNEITIFPIALTCSCHSSWNCIEPLLPSKSVLVATHLTHVNTLHVTSDGAALCDLADALCKYIRNENDDTHSKIVNQKKQKKNEIKIEQYTLLRTQQSSNKPPLNRGTDNIPLSNLSHYARTHPNITHYTCGVRVRVRICIFSRWCLICASMHACVRVLSFSSNGHT